MPVTVTEAARAPSQAVTVAELQGLVTSHSPGPGAMPVADWPLYVTSHGTEPVPPRPQPASVRRPPTQSGPRHRGCDSESF